MTRDQIATVAAAAGFSGGALDTAVAVALAESSGNPSARNHSSIEDSRGLWQINVYAHPQYANVNLYDPATNAAAAYAISSGGFNWHPWSTYTSGSYLAYFQSSSGPIQAGILDTSINIGGFKITPVIAIVILAALYLLLKGEG
jgi:hypothetical protein